MALIRSARSSSNSLTTAWIVPAMGIASRAPISPNTAPPQSTAINTVQRRDLHGAAVDEWLQDVVFDLLVDHHDRRT